MAMPKFNLEALYCLGRSMRRPRLVLGLRIGLAMRERIALHVSAINTCVLCSVFHGALGRAAGLSNDEISAAGTADQADLDARTRAALRYAELRTTKQEDAYPEDVEIFVRSFNEIERAEVATVVDFLTFFNRFNNTLESLLPGAEARRACRRPEQRARVSPVRRGRHKIGGSGGLAVGWYERKIFNPFIFDKAFDVPEFHTERARLLATATGAVLEIGPGTGLNVPNYPEGIAEITTLAPEAQVHPYAAQRASRRGLRIEHVPGDARRLPFPAGRFDTIVCTLVLCTVPEPAVVTRELARVLRPGGQLLFLEHVGAKAGARRILQHLFNALAQLLFCGCDMTRDTERTLVEGGFSFREIERYELAPMIWLHREAIRGIATVE